MILTIDRVNDLLDGMADSFPAALFDGLNGGINLLEEAKPDPEFPEGEMYILGEYCDDLLGQYINLYYGSFAALAEEDPLYQETPNAKQADYIRRLVRGVADHAPELDGYIAKYAKGWNFARIPLVASAIMRVAMYEILYMPDIPHGASINEAVEIAKKYETPETVKFINGILGTFVRRETAE